MFLGLKTFWCFRDNLNRIFIAYIQFSKFSRLESERLAIYDKYQWLGLLVKWI